MKMSSYYKPRIFRNNNGCCICRTKSSSSRFTDSNKYEPFFEKCFCIKEKRTGDICNPCVLLIKRWKKLPNDTDRHWNHVVDARAGPRAKSTHKSKLSPSLASEDLNALTIKTEFTPMTQKSKLKPKLQVTSISSPGRASEDLGSVSALTLKTKFSPTIHKYKSKLKPRRRVISVPRHSLASEDLASSYAVRIRNELSHKTHKNKPELKSNRRVKSIPRHRPPSEDLSGSGSLYKSDLISSKLPDSAASGDNGNGDSKKKASDLQISSYIDLTYWKKTKICCGIIFKGLHGEVMVDPNLFKPCEPCRKEKSPVKKKLQYSQSLEDTDITSSSSSPSFAEGDFYNASNRNTPDTSPPENDEETLMNLDKSQYNSFEEVPGVTSNFIPITMEG